jgi:hypothetical protein
MKTNIKYIKKHFLNRLNKPYLNKEDKEFIILSFEVLEKYIIDNKQIRIFEDKELKDDTKEKILSYSKFKNPIWIKKE